jgi:hypothetical protein
LNKTLNLRFGGPSSGKDCPRKWKQESSSWQPKPSENIRALDIYGGRVVWRPAYTL